MVTVWNTHASTDAVLSNLMTLHEVLPSPAASSFVKEESSHSAPNGVRRCQHQGQCQPKELQDPLDRALGTLHCFTSFDPACFVVLTRSQEFGEAKWTKLTKCISMRGMSPCRQS